MKPESRSTVYTLALIVGILGLGAAVIFGVVDIGSAQQIGLWIASVLGTGAAGVAVAHRPTKPPRTP